MPSEPTVRSKLPTTFWIDLGVIVLSVVLYMLTLDYPGMSGTFPRLVLIMIGVVTSIDLVTMLRQKEALAVSAQPPAQDSSLSLKRQGKVLYLAVLMFVFFAFLHLLGVILGTFAFVFLSGWTLGYKKAMRLLVASAIIAGSVYLIFVVVMETFLPHGYLIELLGG